MECKGRALPWSNFFINIGKKPCRVAGEIPEANKIELTPFFDPIFSGSETTPSTGCVMWRLDPNGIQ